MTTMLSNLLLWARTIALHLWLSVSSIKLYQDVYTHYKGYGIKYILTLSFISSFLCCIFLLDNARELNDYFSNNIISDKVANIDHVINQLPELDYDGNNISTGEPTPLYLHNLSNAKVAVLDPENKLKYSEKKKVPIILSNNKLLITLSNKDGSMQNTFPIKYNQIFSNQPTLLTQEVIKLNLADIFSKTKVIFIYIMFPLLGLVIFINLLLEKSFIIVLIFLTTNLLSVKTPLKTCIRLVLFASGVLALLQAVTLLVFPMLSDLVWFIQIWANLLMVMAMVRLSKRRKRL